jgi:2-amino-4-hydroxy-6-hydroxymethyldihydropteridine diphosphokinase
MEQLRMRILRRSSLYETEPRDLKDQPWFLNIVVEAETGLFPIQLLRTINRVETELGRERRIHKGPRTIDIDILLYGNFVISTPLLIVPHPRMAERRFVLEPLAELAPDLRHPVIKRTVRDLLAEVQNQDVRRLSP